MYLVNSFSLNMVSIPMGEIQFTEADTEAVSRLLKKEGYVPAIGHEDTARLVQKELGLESSPFARVTLTLGKGDELVVAQYRGPRLPEGATQLPEGATIIYYHVRMTCE